MFVGPKTRVKFYDYSSKFSARVCRVRAAADTLGPADICPWSRQHLYLGPGERVDMWAMFYNDPLLVESSYLIAFILEESFKGLLLNFYWKRSKKSYCMYNCATPKAQTLRWIWNNVKHGLDVWAWVCISVITIHHLCHLDPGSWSQDPGARMPTLLLSTISTFTLPCSCFKQAGSENRRWSHVYVFFCFIFWVWDGMGGSGYCAHIVLIDVLVGTNFDIFKWGLYSVYCVARTIDLFAFFFVCKQPEYL